MGSQILNMMMVALFNLMKTPLLICLRRKSCKTFLTLGATWLIPRIRMTKANFGSAGTAFEPKVITLLITVFFDVLLCTFEDVNTLCSPGQTILGQLSGTGSPVF